MSCASQKETNYLAFEMLIKDSSGGFQSAKNSVIKSQSDLEQLYAQINKTRKPGYQVPEIDLKEEMVLALFMGERSSGGYSITVSKIVEKEDAMEVHYVETAPKGMATMAITQPFYMCKTKRSEKEVIFKKSE
ncbi:hypothetical protein KH5_24550 [Urechidicola sp. KH5]